MGLPDLPAGWAEVQFPDGGVFAGRSSNDNTPLPTWDVPDRVIEEVLHRDFEDGKELFDDGNDEIDVILDTGNIQEVLVFPVKDAPTREWEVLTLMRKAHARGIPVEVYYPTHDALRASFDQERLDGLVDERRLEKQLEEHRRQEEEVERRAKGEGDRG